MLRVLVLIFLATISSANANDACSFTEKDTTDARSILKHSDEYIGLLNDITLGSFKGINTTAETAVSLIEEREKLKANFSIISDSAKAIVNGKTDCSAREWNAILFNTAASIRMMADLERFGLIKECKVCWFSVVVLHQSHENLAVKLKGL
ncbi:hypothetical protein VBY75_10180 [Idiomarina sp. HB]|uniref:hypothetical protein n=1 Tax=Idiomarina sp. HB TaxID=3110479 RepID=UPI003A7FC48E